MIKNYFSISWRKIWSNKVYSFINVAGLAFGICACIVIYLIARYEFSFDRFHADGDRIYRITGSLQMGGGEKQFINSPVSEAAGIQYAIPGFEVKAGIHFYNAKVTVAHSGEGAKNFESRNDIIVTEPDYFSIFKYQWLSGNASTALKEPYTVVLTETKGQKYFGNIPTHKMLGKTVIYNDSLKLTVSGIVKDWAEKTDFGFTDFIAISTVPGSFLRNEIATADWTSLGPHQSMAFVKLANGVRAAQINERFARFIKDNVKIPAGGSLNLQLQALTDIHFTTDFHRADDGDNFRKPYLPTLYALIGLAFFILLIAIVNFINLSTAQSMYRTKEIGIRKILGGSKRNIIYQFLTETSLLTLLAVAIAVVFVNPVLSLFKDYIPEGITFDLLNPPVLVFLLVIAIFTSVFSGLYPAKLLSSHLPVLGLKGVTMIKGTDKLNVRKALIVFQFTISLVFIISAMIIGSQIRFMNKTDKGFNTNAIVTMSNWDDHEGKLLVLATNIKHISGVDKVLTEGNAPMGFAQMIDNFKFKGIQEMTIQASAQIGNEDFIPFYQMKLLAGRNMIHSDSLNELVINETMSKVLGFTNPKDAVGKLLYRQDNRGETPYPISGVVADFHTGSFHETIRPTVIENATDRKFSIAVKLTPVEKQTAEVKQILAQIEKEWRAIYPESGFNYSFLNESIAALFEQEQKTAWLVNAAMCITICISCMGLFGLVMFTAGRRTKEIGIRKVLGASVINISFMLSKDFLKLIAIAVIVASPIAYYFMHSWLQDFTYRTNINPIVFLLAGCMMIFLAFISIGFQAIKAAVANPVKSLRTE
jgi:putative ABC transport system permease protein